MSDKKNSDEGMRLYLVELRREQTASVYVAARDEAEAKEIAREEACEWETQEVEAEHTEAIAHSAHVLANVDGAERPLGVDYLDAVDPPPSLDHAAVGRRHALGRVVSAPEMVSADEARAMLEAYGYVTTPPWEHEYDGEDGYVIHAPEAAVAGLAHLPGGEDGAAETDAAMICAAINDFGRLARTVLALHERLAAMEAERAGAVKAEREAIAGMTEMHR